MEIGREVAISYTISEDVADTCRLPAAGPYLPLPHPTGESHS